MKIFVLISVVCLFSSVYGSEVETAAKNEKATSIPMQHRSAEPLLSPQEAVALVQTPQQQRVSSNPTSYSASSTHTVQQPPVVAVPSSYQQLGFGANSSPYQVNPANTVPGGAYHHVYQQQQQAQQEQAQPQAAVYESEQTAFAHPKEASKLKKPVYPAKESKPNYYPKQSSYASIPPQDGQVAAATSTNARFVADPTRSHLVEEVADGHLQQVVFASQAPQYYSPAAPQSGVPPYTNFVQGVVPSAPYLQTPYQPLQNTIETATVKYEQTEHGFMDRVWGEVETMRQSIATDFFGAIPAFFSRIWDNLVGMVSSASARMLTVDWITLLDIARQALE